MNEKFPIENSKIKLLKAADISERLNVSKAFAYKLMQTGEIRTVQILGARRVRPEDLEKFIQSRLIPSGNY